jgi:hypothetical protein
LAARYLTCVLACAAAGLIGPAAAAQATPERAAQTLESDPLFVAPGASGRLSVPERGVVRIQIVREAIGRIKIAVVTEDDARSAGGAAGYAQEIARRIDLRGTLIVVAGRDYYALTSYPDSDAAVRALRAAVDAHKKLVRQLTDAIERIAKIDPGSDADPRPTDIPGIPDTDDFFDDVEDTFRIAGLIVAIAIALPFILLTLWLTARWRRKRSRDREVEQHGERTVRDELVSLGDDIRSLDLDTSMPNADRAALADYEQALVNYDKANDLLLGDPSGYQVDQAKAAIAAGRRYVDAARRRLDESV